MLKTTDTLDQIGFFARNPYDLKLFLDVVRVKGKHYPFVEKSFNDINSQSIESKKLKIRLVKTHVWDMATSEVQKTVLQFVDKLDSLGKFDVEEFNLPEIFSKAHNIHELIYSKSLSYYFQKESFYFTEINTSFTFTKASIGYNYDNDLLLSQPNDSLATSTYSSSSGPNISYYIPMRNMFPDSDSWYKKVMVDYQLAYSNGLESYTKTLINP